MAQPFRQLGAIAVLAATDHVKFSHGIQQTPAATKGCKFAHPFIDASSREQLSAGGRPSNRSPADTPSEKDGDERSKHSFSRNFTQKMPNLDGVRKRRFLSDTTASSLAGRSFLDNLLSNSLPPNGRTLLFKTRSEFMNILFRTSIPQSQPESPISAREFSLRGLLTSDLIEREGEQICRPTIFDLDPGTAAFRRARQGQNHDWIAGNRRFSGVLGPASSGINSHKTENFWTRTAAYQTSSNLRPLVGFATADCGLFCCKWTNTSPCLEVKNAYIRNPASRSVTRIRIPVWMAPGTKRERECRDFSGFQYNFFEQEK